MKKIVCKITLFALTVLSLFLVCACGSSSAPIVGTYKLVTATTRSAFSQTTTYNADGTDALITENSFVFEIKANYKWDMTITLPGITETEDGRWDENEGVYTFKEDSDDPALPITFNADGTVNLTIGEDGYIIAATLKKVS